MLAVRGPSLVFLLVTVGAPLHERDFCKLFIYCTSVFGHAFGALRRVPPSGGVVRPPLLARLRAASRERGGDAVAEGEAVGRGGGGRGERGGSGRGGLSAGGKRRRLNDGGRIPLSEGLALGSGRAVRRGAPPSVAGGDRAEALVFAPSFRGRGASLGPVPLRAAVRRVPLPTGAAPQRHAAAERFGGRRRASRYGRAHARETASYYGALRDEGSAAFWPFLSLLSSFVSFLQIFF